MCRYTLLSSESSSQHSDSIPLAQFSQPTSPPPEETDRANVSHAAATPTTPLTSSGVDAFGIPLEVVTTAREARVIVWEVAHQLEVPYKKAHFLEPFTHCAQDHSCKPYAPPNAWAVS
ncbi:unnamed protein product [Phytophthora lilii]|uniref:Unnamed protein product n=1 Tax=Phytophthora lilii TaxID=2077276 RepID=A0A9W6X2W4_9STRA|nr:unnamed protein product [Phytophthora lilii]